MKCKVMLLLILLIAAAGSLQAQIPRTFSLQGALTDASGNALSNGIHQVRISLYTQSGGGSALFSETHSATVKDGVFGVLIGSVSPIPGTMLFDRQYYAGISVDGGAELTPRTPVTAVPYALHAASASEASALAAGAAGVVTNVNGADGSVTLQGAGGTSVTRNGSTITISSSGGSSTGIAGLQNTDGTITVQNPNGPVATIGVATAGIGVSQLADNAVVGSKLAQGSVSAPKLEEGSVTTYKIAPAAITLDRISPSGAQTGQVPQFNGSGIVWATPQSGGGFSLPYSGQTAATATAFALKSTGGHGVIVEAPIGKSGIVGTVGKPWLRTNVGVLGFASAGEGVCGEAESGIGVRGWSQTGNGIVGFSQSGTAIRAENTGTGGGLVAIAQSGIGLQAASTSGTGLFAMTGTGVALKARSQSGDIIEGYSGQVLNPDLRFRVTTNGYVRCDGQYISGGADVAEAVDFEGSREKYEPGDVLVISADSDRHVTLCSKANARNVAGVYATKPGMMLTTARISEDISHLIPLGVLGIIPTKVCAENGPIRRGDLLVTSSTPGHAMKAVPVMVGGVEVYPTGAVIGKAMQNFDGPSNGMIEVLVNVK